MLVGRVGGVIQYYSNSITSGDLLHVVLQYYTDITLAGYDDSASAQ